MTTGRKIMLIGPMGAGKTALGSRLANYIRWKFYDTDHCIIARTGVGIAQIFAQEGEAGFRQREHNMLKEILSYPDDAVVSCGGGIVLKPENRTLIMQQALVVFLDISVNQQLQRIKHDRQRPLVQVDDPLTQLQQLREARLWLYEGLADIRISTDNHHFSISFNRLLTSIRQFIQK